MSGRRLEARPSRRVLTQRRSPAWPAWPAWPLGPGEPGRTRPAVRRRPPVRRTHARAAGIARAARAAWSGTSWSRPAGSVTARWHRARLAPAVRVVVLDGRPWPMMPARGAAGRTRSRRPVQAVRARRHPPSVRQPIPARPRCSIGAARVGRRAVGYRPSVRRGPAMRGSAMRGSSLWGSAVRRRTPWGSTVLGSTVRHAAARAVGIRAAPVRPAWMRPAHRGRTHGWCGHRWHARVRAARVWCPAARERPVRSAAVRVPAARPAVVRVSAMRAARAARPARHPAAGHPARHPGVARASVRGRSWREATRLGPSSLGPSSLGPSKLRPCRLRPSGLRPSRLADPRLPGRHLARAPQQLPDFVVLGLTAWPGRIIVLGREPIVGGIRPVAAAVPLVPGRTVRVTAEAGVATFHPIPPGPLCPPARQDTCPLPCSVGRQKSPV